MAVLAVVAFHVGDSPIARNRGVGGVELLPGGFTGVDVFFVISGFVITALLLRRADRDGGVALRDFAARRVRRILPALALMSVVVLALGIVVLDPFGAQQFAARTSMAAALLGANVYLYRHTGYFDSSAAANPFLHTWSLSVEEQTYLLLPLGVALAAAVALRRRRSTAWCVGAGAVAVAATSFALAVALSAGWGTSVVQAPERLSFLAAPTRWWEFAAGALVAAWASHPRQLPRRVAAVLGIAGLVAIVGGALRLGPGTPWPSLWTLVPVLGTVGVLVAGATTNPAGQLLSSRPLGWIGDRSYAWYLWHWPCIVLAAAIWPSLAWIPAVAAVASLLPAAASYRWVEQPLRHDSSIVGRRAALLGAVCTGAVLLVGLIVLTGADRGWGLREEDGWYDRPEGRNVGCLQLNRDLRADWPETACTSPPPPGGAGTVLVLGDAQASGVTPAVIDAAASLGLGTTEWNRAGCPFLARAPLDAPGCGDWQVQAWSLVERLRPAAVVLAADESAYTGVAGSGELLGDADGNAPATDADAAANWAGALAATLDRLDALGIPAVVVGGAPDLGPTFPRDVQSLLRPHPPVPQVDLTAAQRRRSSVWEQQEQTVRDHPTATLVDPLPVLCDPVCRGVVDGVWRFHERNELTNAGSRLLTDELRTALGRLTGR